MRQALFALIVAAPLAVSTEGALARNDMVSNEVLVAFANSAGPRTIGGVQRRHRLRPIEQIPLQLAGVTIYRWRIAGRRPVAEVVRGLRRETAVVLAQPNYRYAQRHNAAARRRPASEGEQCAPSCVIRMR